jgi:uncharacterized protein (UPF0276 family)
LTLSPRFAINYSPQAEALLADNRIHLDLFKCPDWLEVIEPASQHLPVYIHFPLAAGDDSLSQVNWTTLEQLRSSTNTKYVNCHLIAPSKTNPNDPRSVAQAEDQMHQDAAWLVDRFGQDHLIIENYPYVPEEGSFLLAAIDPRRIRRVIEAANSGFLLDLAHVRLSAPHLGMSEQEYLNELPLDRIRELHLSGLGFYEGTYCDHLPLTPNDKSLIEYAFTRIGAGEWACPEIIAFEYGGIRFLEDRSNQQVIAEQAPWVWDRIQNLIHKHIPSA